MALLDVDRDPIGQLNGSDGLRIAWKGWVERRQADSLPFWGAPRQRFRWPLR